MNTTVYRIEKPDGTWYWSFQEPTLEDEHITHVCGLDAFLEMEGEINKGDIKQLLKEATKSKIPTTIPLPHPPKITHSNFLMTLMQLNLSKSLAENVFERFLAEMVANHFSEGTLASYIKDAKEEELIENVPKDPVEIIQED